MTDFYSALNRKSYSQGRIIDTVIEDWGIRSTYNPDMKSIVGEVLEDFGFFKGVKKVAKGSGEPAIDYMPTIQAVQQAKPELIITERRTKRHLKQINSQAEPSFDRKLFGTVKKQKILTPEQKREKKQEQLERRRINRGAPTLPAPVVPIVLPSAPPPPQAPQPKMSPISKSLQKQTQLQQIQPTSKPTGRKPMLLVDANAAKIRTEVTKDIFKDNTASLIPGSETPDAEETAAINLHLNKDYTGMLADPSVQNNDLFPVFVKNITDPNARFVDWVDFNMKNVANFILNMAGNRKVVYLTSTGQQKQLTHNRKDAGENIRLQLKNAAKTGMVPVYYIMDANDNIVDQFAIYRKKIKVKDAK